MLLAHCKTSSRLLISVVLTICSGYSSLTQADNSPINRVVAVVDSSVILQSELDNALQEMQASGAAQGIPNNSLKSIVLKQLISNKLQLNLLAKSSIQISEEQLNQALLTIAAQQGKQTLRSFQEMLDKEKPGQYALLRKQVREDLSLDQLRKKMVGSRINITNQQIERYLQTTSESAVKDSSNSSAATALNTNQYHLESVEIIATPNEHSRHSLDAVGSLIGNDVKTELEAQRALKNIIDKMQTKYGIWYKNISINIKGQDLGWSTINKLPVEFNSELTRLQPKQVSNPIRVGNNTYVLRLLDKGTDSTALSKTQNSKNAPPTNNTVTKAVIISQYKVSHILIKTSKGVSDDVAKLKIDDIYDKLQHGEDFASLASIYSNDTGSAATKGDLGWVSIGDMVAPFEKMMQVTAVNDYSIPFKTQFGWHILKVYATRQQDVTDEYKHNMARNVLFQRQYDQALDDWLKEIYNAAYIDIKP